MESLDLEEERSPLELATPMESLEPREDNRNVLLPMEEVDAQDAEEEQKEGRRRRRPEDEGLGHDVATDEIEEEGEEGREPRAGASPKTPSRLEREQHELTHTPYRSWCDHCVRARGRNRPHQAKKPEEKDEATVPRISFDYFFLSEEEETTNKNPILVMLDESTGEKYDRGVDHKGLGEEW